MAFFAVLAASFAGLIYGSNCSIRAVKSIDRFGYATMCMHNAKCERREGNREEKKREGELRGRGASTGQQGKVEVHNTKERRKGDQIEHPGCSARPEGYNLSKMQVVGR